MAVHQEINPDVSELPYIMADTAIRLAKTNTSKTSGRIAVLNADGETETILGSNGMAQWVGDTTPPGRPIGVNATAHLGTALVRWDGELEGGIPEDFLRVDIYARKTGESGEGTLVGSMRDAGELATGVFDVGSTIDVWAVALDNAHDANGFPAYNISAESEHVSVEILPIVSQQEFDEAADNILAAAEESAKAHVQLVEATMDEISDAVAENTDAIELEKTLREEAVKAAQDTANSVKSETEKLKGDYKDMATDVKTAQADIVKLATKTGNLTETTITKSVVEYAVGTGAAAPTSGWSTSSPTVSGAQRAWMRTKVTYGDGRSETTNPVVVTGAQGQQGAQGPQGATGATGAQGVSVTAITPFYCIAASKPAQPTNKAPGGSWTTIEPAYVKDRSLYTCQRVDYSNGQWSWTTVQLSSSYGLASVALMTANGKNKRWVQKTAPSSTDLQQGDEWWQTSSKPLETYWTGEPNNSPSVLVDHSNDVEHIYVWNGSRWNEQLLSAQYLLVPGTVSAGLVTSDFFDGRVFRGGTFIITNERIQLNDKGFVMVDASGNPLVTLDATNGTATFKNVKVTDGTIESGTMLGATIKGGEYQLLDKSGKQIGTINSAGMNLGGKLVYGYSDTLKQYCLTLDGIIMAKGEMRGGKMIAPYIYSNAEYNSSDPKKKYRGVVITDGGLFAYKGNGKEEYGFTIAADGTVKLDGAISTNGEIHGAKLVGNIVNGGKVVGGTISTRSEDKRGITLNGNQLTAYNEQGQTILSLNGAGNGTALLTGGLKTAQAGRRIEVMNSVYGSYTEGTVKGYDPVGEAWHVVGTSDRTTGTSTDWYTQTLEMGISPQQSEFRVSYQNRWKTTTMHMLADRIDIVASGTASADSPYSRGVYVNGYRIDWEQDWHTLQISSGISVVGAKCQYGIRCGLLAFIGRLRTPANGDNTLCDLQKCYAGFASEPVNRTWIVGTMKNNVASTARCYIEANTTLLKVNGGPWDWVDIGSVVIAL